MFPGAGSARKGPADSGDESSDEGSDNEGGESEEAEEDREVEVDEACDGDLEIAPTLPDSAPTPAPTSTEPAKEDVASLYPACVGAPRTAPKQDEVPVDEIMAKDREPAVEKHSAKSSESSLVAPVEIAKAPEPAVEMHAAKNPESSGPNSREDHVTPPQAHASRLQLHRLHGIYQS